MYFPSTALQFFTVIIEAEATILGIVCAFYLFLLGNRPVTRPLELFYNLSFKSFFGFSSITIVWSLSSMYLIGIGVLKDYNLQLSTILAIGLVVFSIVTLYNFIKQTVMSQR